VKITLIVIRIKPTVSTIINVNRGKELRYWAFIISYGKIKDRSKNRCCFRRILAHSNDFPKEKKQIFDQNG